MIYLACPYSHPDATVREERFRLVSEFTARLMRGGQAVFSPVVHSHPLTAFGLPLGWDFWERMDRRFLMCCDELLVLKLPGWETSVGVRAEIRIAEELGKPVRTAFFDDPAPFAHVAT